MTKKLFTIPFGQPFLETLADGICHRLGHDPLLLSKSVIILPTRRGCLGLKEAFQSRRLGQILPRIVALADLEQDPTLPGFVPEALPAAMPSSQQLGLMTQLVLNFISAQDRKSSLTSALNLAQELIKLIDEVYTSDVSMGQLHNLVSDRYAQHWQQTLDFLKIITDYWPKILTEHGLMEGSQRRRDNLRLISKNWRPSYPVILAGTTATRPATRDLARSIFEFDQGLIVLPGFQKTRDLLPPTHPLYTLDQFVKHLGSPPLESWMNQTKPELGRGKLLDYAMAPTLSDQSYLSPQDARHIVDTTSMIECQDRDQEALVIALKIRQALTENTDSIAVITPDMELTRRIQTHLNRWDIVANTSQGVPLGQTVVGRFLVLIARLSASLDPRTLLATLKHPLCNRGDHRSEHLTHVRSLDLRLRRVRQPDLTCPTFLREDQHSWYQSILAKLNLSATPTTLKDHLSHLIQIAESLCAPDLLWAQTDGKAAADFLMTLEPYASAYPELSKRDFADLLPKLMNQSQVHDRQGIGSPVRILGALEARQAYAPLMILAGLNEGTWPQPPSQDPWLNRQMRLDWGLPDPQRRVGLAAHDFCLGFSAPQVMITRSLKESGSATIPSRWWLRIQTMLEMNHIKLSKDRHLLDWAQKLDHPNKVIPAAEMKPCPPLQSRPIQLSTTDIEQLMRDPYGYYARRILNLRKLDRPDEDLSARDLGNLIHESLDLYHRRYPDQPCYNHLIECGKEVFAPYLSDAHVQHFWWPRFQRISSWLIDQWHERSGTHSHTEIEGILALEGNVSIKSIADRIEYKNGQAVILDYKTGSKLPSDAEVRSGLSPQLTIEAILLEGGAFASIGSQTVHALEYWHLHGGADGGQIKQLKDITSLIDEADTGVRLLLSHFISNESPFICAPWGEKKVKNKDYLQLARFMEWTS